jgi:hypothetical protein
MPNAFDPYREALVVETATVWPDDMSNVSPADRERIEKQLHSDPAKTTELQYVRLYTGFCRHITVTAADLERLKGRK